MCVTKRKAKTKCTITSPSSVFRSALVISKHSIDAWTNSPNPYLIRYFVSWHLHESKSINLLKLVGSVSQNKSCTYWYMIYASKFRRSLLCPRLTPTVCPNAYTHSLRFSCFVSEQVTLKVTCTAANLCSYQGHLLLTWINFNSDMNNHYINYKLWEEITDQFPNFNGCTVNFSKYISDFFQTWPRMWLLIHHESIGNS